MKVIITHADRHGMTAEWFDRLGFYHREQFSHRGTVKGRPHERPLRREDLVKALRRYKAGAEGSIVCRG